MVKRLVDLLSAAIGLLIAAPLLALAALGIALTTRGPVIYRARRAGLRGRPFTMYKLRTMRLDHLTVRSRVTGVNDARVFPLGRVLRATKIDELPQLFNVLRGEMSIVGPRPEDPAIVLTHYAPSHWQTLAVRPGLSSPGSLYHDTHGAAFLTNHDPEASYLERLLPLKLAIDLVYVRRASLWYDLRIVVRTLVTIAGRLAGRRDFPEPPELGEARRLVEPTRQGALPRVMTLETIAPTTLPPQAALANGGEAR